MRIVLTGFSGSGKTTVGRAVAAELGLPFIDLDQQIEQRAGSSVLEIFSKQGEGRFRELERQAALEHLDGAGSWIISTGGGTLVDEHVRARAEEIALVVCLHVPLAVALERVGSDKAERRPLLSGYDVTTRARDLWTARQGVYALAHAAVQTDGRSAAAVAAEVCAIARGEAVPVSLGPRGYPVYVGAGLLDRLPGLLVDSGLGARSAALVCDRAVTRRFGGGLERGLRQRRIECVRISQAPGDQHKTLRSAQRILDRLVGGGFERSSPILALGGGMVSDLAGFAAAVLLRGVPFVPLPTTVLAQADASVGGKVGVNHPRGKNLIGAFHQPRLVVADVDTLRTLPVRQVRSGLAEIVKCGIIRDERILDELERHAEEVVRGGADALLVPLRRAVAVKARVVARDERESGERRVLNFGHTIGHALEAATGYRRLLHGEAVAVGMVFALGLGEARGVTPSGLRERAVRLLERLGLPTGLGSVRPEALAPFMATDKKLVGGTIRFVLAAGDGRTLEVPLSPEAVMAELTRDR